MDTALSAGARLQVAMLERDLLRFFPRRNVVPPDRMVPVGRQDSAEGGLIWWSGEIPIDAVFPSGVFERTAKPE
jgi:hypothetical protein